MDIIKQLEIAKSQLVCAQNTLLEIYNVEKSMGSNTQNQDYDHSERAAVLHNLIARLSGVGYELEEFIDVIND